MAKKSNKSIPEKVNDIRLDKIKVFFKRSILNDILKILTMNEEKRKRNLNHSMIHINIVYPCMNLIHLI